MSGVVNVGGGECREWWMSGVVMSGGERLTILTNVFWCAQNYFLTTTYQVGNTLEETWNEWNLNKLASFDAILLRNLLYLEIGSEL